MNHQLPQRMLSFKEFVAHPMYEMVKSGKNFNRKFGKSKSQQKLTRKIVLDTIHACQGHQLQSSPDSSSGTDKHDLGTQTMLPCDIDGLATHSEQTLCRCGWEWCITNAEQELVKAGRKFSIGRRRFLSYVAFQIELFRKSIDWQTLHAKYTRRYLKQYPLVKLTYWEAASALLFDAIWETYWKEILMPEAENQSQVAP